MCLLFNCKIEEQPSTLLAVCIFLHRDYLYTLNSLKLRIVLSPCVYFSVTAAVTFLHLHRVLAWILALYRLQFSENRQITRGEPERHIQSSAPWETVNCRFATTEPSPRLAFKFASSLLPNDLDSACCWLHQILTLTGQRLKMRLTNQKHPLLFSILRTSLEPNWRASNNLKNYIETFADSLDLNSFLH